MHVRGVHRYLHVNFTSVLFDDKVNRNLVAVTDGVPFSIGVNIVRQKCVLYAVKAKTKYLLFRCALAFDSHSA